MELVFWICVGICALATLAFVGIVIWMALQDKICEAKLNRLEKRLYGKENK